MKDFIFFKFKCLNLLEFEYINLLHLVLIMHGKLKYYVFKICEKHSC